MKSMGHYGMAIALLVAAALSGVLLVAGCELSGQYNDDNLHVQFGNTNTAVQGETH